MLTGRGRVCFQSKASHSKLHPKPVRCGRTNDRSSRLKFRDSETCLFGASSSRRGSRQQAHRKWNLRDFWACFWMPLTFMLPWNVHRCRDLFCFSSFVLLLERNCSCSSREVALSGLWFTSVVRISLPWLRGFGAIKIPWVTCCLLNDPLSLISATELHPGHEGTSD